MIKIHENELGRHLPQWTSMLLFKMWRPLLLTLSEIWLKDDGLHYIEKALKISHIKIAKLSILLLYILHIKASKLTDLIWSHQITCWVCYHLLIHGHFLMVDKSHPLQLTTMVITISQPILGKLRQYWPLLKIEIASLRHGCSALKCRS